MTAYHNEIPIPLIAKRAMRPHEPTTITPRVITHDPALVIVHRVQSWCDTELVLAVDLNRDQHGG